MKGRGDLQFTPTWRVRVEDEQTTEFTRPTWRVRVEDEPTPQFTPTWRARVEDEPTTQFTPTWRVRVEDEQTTQFTPTWRARMEDEQTTEFTFTWTAIRLPVCEFSTSDSFGKTILYITTASWTFFVSEVIVNVSPNILFSLRKICSVGHLIYFEVNAT